MAIKIIRLMNETSLPISNCVMTIGNFDGIHLGHQSILYAVQQAAKNLAVPGLMLTFSPYPWHYFNSGSNQATTAQLMSLREKLQVLSQIGIDYLAILPFNRELAQVEAVEFVQKYLINQLKPLQVMVGEDFRFGRNRQGNVTLLQHIGCHAGFEVICFADVMINNERVSSTRIRQALQMGDLNTVASLLGRSYTLSGKVQKGQQLGRNLGFPTANINLQRRLLPLTGVYIVYMHGIAKHPLPGVANIGYRPTVDGSKGVLEVHLLNFNVDIYHRYVTVEFCQKIRDEKRFASIDELKQQIALDVQYAHQYFLKQD